MVGAIEYRDFHIDDGIARDHAGLHRFLDALVHGGNVFARHRAADDAVDELVALALRQRLELQPHMAVLAAAAGLANELALGFDRAAQGFAIRDLRLADIGFDLELALHAIDDDLEMQFAHAFDDGLAGLRIGVHAKGRIFLRQALQSQTHFFLVDLGFRLHRNGNHRLRETPSFRG